MEFKDFEVLGKPWCGQPMQIVRGPMVVGTPPKHCVVEDLFSEIDGGSWRDALDRGNPAATIYGLAIYEDADTPVDEDVFYVKVDGLGMLVHQSWLDWDDLLTRVVGDG